MAFIPCPQPPWSSRNFKAALREAPSYLSSQVSGRTQPAAAQGRDGNTAPSAGQQKSKYGSVPKYFPPEISLAIHWGKFAWLCSGLPFTDHQLLLQNHSGYSKIETLKEQQVISQYESSKKKVNTSVFQGSETHNFPQELVICTTPASVWPDGQDLPWKQLRFGNPRGRESRMHSTVRRTRKVLRGYWQLCTKTEILWKNSPSLIHPSIGCGC